MKYLLNYVKEQQTGFDKLHFGLVDAMVLCQFSYLDINLIKMNKNNSIKIKNIDESLIKKMVDSYFLKNLNSKFLRYLLKSNRYSNIEILDYIFINDNKASANFFAYTARIDKNTIAVVFRGTDVTFSGWKESFEMSYCPFIKAQSSSRIYLNTIAKKYNGNIIVTGHSKGGNLAVYSSTLSDKSIHNRIKLVYDLDGPGFLPEFYDTNYSKEILNKTVKYIPEKCFVGNLLESRNKIFTVKSKGAFLMQHSLFNWGIENNTIKTVESESFISKSTMSALNKWLKLYTRKDRKEILNILSEIIIKSKIPDFNYIFENKIKSLQLLNSSIGNLDDEKQSKLKKAIGDFFEISKNEITSKIFK